MGKDVREQSMWICSFYMKDSKSFDAMIEKNEVGMDKGTSLKISKTFTNNRRC